MNTQLAPDFESRCAELTHLIFYTGAAPELSLPATGLQVLAYSLPIDKPQSDTPHVTGTLGYWRAELPDGTALAQGHPSHFNDFKSRLCVCAVDEVFEVRGFTAEKEGRIIYPPPPAGRFMVVRGNEARAWRWALDSGGGVSGQHALRKAAANLNAGTVAASNFVGGWIDEDMYTHGWWHLIDTAAPPHDLDKEIVSAVEASTRNPIGALWGTFGVVIHGRTISPGECRAAWSRVLASKVAASDEARRRADYRTVLGPIDDGDEVGARDAE